MIADPVIGVVGLGTMGLGIAQVYAAAGCTVIGFDGHNAARGSAADRMRAALEPRVTAGKLAAVTSSEMCVSPLARKPHSAACTSARPKPRPRCSGTMPTFWIAPDSGTDASP